MERARIFSATVQRPCSRNTQVLTTQRDVPLSENGHKWGLLYEVHDACVRIDSMLKDNADQALIPL